MVLALDRSEPRQVRDSNPVADLLSFVKSVTHLGDESLPWRPTPFSELISLSNPSQCFLVILSSHCPPITSIIR